MRAGVMLLVLLLLADAVTVPVEAALAPMQTAGPPAGARAAVALLPALLGRDGQKADNGLVVVGRTRWLPAALASLPATLTVVLLGDLAAGADAVIEALDAAACRWPGAVFLVADDSVEALRAWLRDVDLSTFGTLLLWTSAPSADAAPPAQLAVQSAVHMRWLCLMNLYVVVTAAGDGRTFVQSRRCGEADPWAGGWWLGPDGRLEDPDYDTALIRVHCRKWPALAAHLGVYVFTNSSKNDDFFPSTVVRELQKITRQELAVLKDPPMTVIRAAVAECAVGFAAYSLGFSVQYSLSTEDFPSSHLRIIVVVPAGLGKHRPLRGIVGEFSTALWCATGGAVVAVVLASLTLARGWRRGHRGSALWSAVRLGLSPLLDQPVPQATGQRPLLGAWLLTCVVLSAAYTGQLLAELSSKHRLDINSVEELAASGLVIKVQGPLHYLLFRALFDVPISRLRPGTRPVSAELADVAQQRSSSLVLHEELAAEIGPWLVEPARVHAFRVKTHMLQGHTWATRGSPLVGPVRKLLGRARAAGLLTHWKAVAGLRRLRRVLARHPGLEGTLSLVDGAWRRKAARSKALALQDLAPAFAVLAIGLLSACIALGFERISKKRCHFGKMKHRISI